MTTELFDRPWRRRSAPTRCVGFVQIEELIRQATEALAGFDCCDELLGDIGSGLKPEFCNDASDNLRRSFAALGRERSRLNADHPIDGPTLRHLSRRLGSHNPERLKLALQAADQLLSLLKQWEATNAALEAIS